jgi:uncharacterized membrane protein YqjE
MADRVKENAKKKSEREIIKRINMAEHDMRLKSLGVSERASRLFVRALIVIIPLALIAFWLLHSK